MRVLIIEDSGVHLDSLRRYIARQFDGAEIISYVPAEHDGVVPDVAEHAADVILLDDDLEDDRDALGWLAAMRDQPGCPPVIYLTSQGDEYVAVRAIRLGVANCANKRDLASARLAEVIRTTLVDAEPELRAPRAVAQPAAAGAAGTRTRSTAHGAPPGEADDGYRFRRPIGSGAMSKVYLAERARDGLSLALKIIDLKALHSEEIRKRFLQEAELASSIDSPYVVRIYDFGFTPVYGYMAMELFTRGDLKQRLERGIRPRDAVVYLWNIAKGLDVIHRVGIVHRDLKPDNIMFRSDDSLAIADFGISKRLVEATQMTTVGKILGTPHYMSPEQGQGLPVGPHSDIYSAGVIFYEMLTGRRPYDAPDPMTLIRRHVTAPVPRLPHTLARFQPIVDRTLAKKPEDRYADAGALADAAGQHLATP